MYVANKEKNIDYSYTILNSYWGAEPFNKELDYF